MLRFMCLGSGSSGNCYYLGTERYAILLDAGIAGRTIKQILKDNGLIHIPIRALFITHDHTDHIRGASMISSLMDCPVYTTKEVHDGMDRNYGLQKKIPTINRRYLQREEVFDVPTTHFRITPFSVPHDSRDNVGYFVEWQEGSEQVKFCLVTDCGRVTDVILRYVKQADHLVVESNHDVDMLMNGSYPNYLKLRVRGEGGHLSNDECAEMLRTTFHPSLRHIFLCHLSADNNTPDLAYRTASKALTEAGGKVGYQGITLAALARTSPSQLYYLAGESDEILFPEESD
ncbi:MAG: MBL fold metallo-hydrolase [Bacteroidales bacterium]|nr:MBL fold metallo-hydrolase [Bacteroidales bacterium]